MLNGLALIAISVIMFFVFFGSACERSLNMTAYMQGGTLSHTICLK